MRPVSFIYLYKEGCESNAEGENINIPFICERDAKAYLRERVEHHFGVPLEDVKAKLNPDDQDSFSDTYVSDGEHWWEVQKLMVRRSPGFHGEYDNTDDFDAGPYHLNFYGSCFDGDREYGYMQIFRFEDDTKPGVLDRECYIKYGGPEVLICIGNEFSVQALKSFIRYFIDHTKNNDRVDLYEMLEDWRCAYLNAERRKNE